MIATAKSNKIPVFGADTTAAENGGLLFAIGFDYYEAGRLTGKIAVDILKGKKPKDIPIQFMKFPESTSTLIDLDTAEELDITIPQRYIDNANLLIKNGKLITREN